MASESDKDSGYLSPFSAAFPLSWPCGPILDSYTNNIQHVKQQNNK